MSLFDDFIEPVEAFPYLAPDEDLKKKYAYMYRLEEGPATPVIKRAFDICFSIIVLIVLCVPFLTLFIVHLIECVFIKSNRGPFLYYYYSISKNRCFRKWLGYYLSS